MEYIEGISIVEQEEVLEQAANEEKQRDFYEKLRQRVSDYIKKNPKSKYINYVMLFPDLFHLLCRLFGDGRVPMKNKVYLGMAIVYCVSPIDIIPDIIPGGFTDDMLLIIKTLSDLIKEVDNDIINEHWAGEGNIIKTIKDLFEMTADILNTEKIINKVTEFFNNRKKSS